MSDRIACVVEGHGEVDSVPIVLRRIAEMVGPGLGLDIPRLLRYPKQQLLKPGSFERVAVSASGKAGQNDAVMVVLDADNDCPKDLAAELPERMRRAVGHGPHAAVIARREFKAWFIAVAESLSKRWGMHCDLSAPEDPQSLQGTKE
ncbi:MAG: hypothetical protein ACP5U2_07210 [Bryobacteraceae bacterium]